MILDAGVFIAVDNPAQRGIVVALMQRLLNDNTPPHTNTATLAQAWRNPRRQVPMAKLVAATTVHAFGDPQVIGLKCATTATSDVVDASLAVLAQQLNDSILTTDPDDMTRLGAPHVSL